MYKYVFRSLRYTPRVVIVLLFLLLRQKFLIPEIKEEEVSVRVGWFEDRVVWQRRNRSWQTEDSKSKQEATSYNNSFFLPLL